MPLEFIQTEIEDVIALKYPRYQDERGFFEERYKFSDLEKVGMKRKFVQVNHSFSRKGVLRGLHYQKHPFEQGKFVIVIKGEIMDVAVDIRLASRTFKKWISFTLSEDNCLALWIPPGFAHGFLATENSDIIYLTTREYNREYDSGIRWNDPELGVKWPIDTPILSEKDKNLKLLKELIDQKEL